jgi:hypothetical protein
MINLKMGLFEFIICMDVVSFQKSPVLRFFFRQNSKNKHFFSFRNNYLYPLESFYDASTFSTNSKRKSKQRNYNHQQIQHLQQQQQLLLNQQQQQQLQTLELHKHMLNINNNNNNNSNTTNNISNLMKTSTLKSNTQNNTNSNFLVSSSSSSSTSTTNNRRHDMNKSILKRTRFHLFKNIQIYCSWKWIAFLFLFITLTLFSLTIYLSGKQSIVYNYFLLSNFYTVFFCYIVMRAYNLNWNLGQNSPGNQLTVPILPKNQGLCLFLKGNQSQNGSIFNFLFFSRPKATEPSIIFKNWRLYRRFYKSK